MNAPAAVLLYGFGDERREKITLAAKTVKAKIILASPSSMGEKIGFLFGKKGFRPSSAGENFDFPHEFMVMDGLKGKKLDAYLAALRENDAEVKLKAVTTPRNTLWTLKYLCEHIMREHGAFIGEQNEQQPQ